ncbi:MAG: hypothetical protein ABIE84_01985 [bacterium]
MVLSGREKATIFLSILGAETSSRILRYLPDELADLIAAGINHLPSPSPEALDEVMAEFKSHLALPSNGPTPRLEQPQAKQPSTPKKNYSFLVYERPQMVAFLMTLLADDKKQQILSTLKERDTIEELTGEIKTNSLSEKIAESLKKHFSERLFS